MNIDPEMSVDCVVRPDVATEAPSVDFIQAISEFLDTDPNDLLLELGYYTRDNEAAPR
jgi:hypothetical protein